MKMKLESHNKINASTGFHRVNIIEILVTANTGRLDVFIRDMEQARKKESLCGLGRSGRGSSGLSVAPKHRN